MGNGEFVDRRGTGEPSRGVQKLVKTDGNGGREVSYQFNVERAKTWVGFVAGAVTLLLTVGAAVMGGVRYGISSEVHGEVQTQIIHECEPGGMIDDHVQNVAIEAVEDFKGAIQDDLDHQDRRLKDIEDLGGDLKAGQESAQLERERNSEELKMLIRRAIDSNGGD